MGFGSTDDRLPLGQQALRLQPADIAFLTWCESASIQGGADGGTDWDHSSRAGFAEHPDHQRFANSMTSTHHESALGDSDGDSDGGCDGWSVDIPVERLKT